MKIFCSSIVDMITQLCQYTKKNSILYFKILNFMVCELYLKYSSGERDIYVNKIIWKKSLLQLNYSLWKPLFIYCKSSMDSFVNTEHWSIWNCESGKSTLILASLVAQWLRICLQCRGCGFDPWVGKSPWRRAWQPTPVFLPGESHGRRNLAGYSP